jgi:hypothetical protein
MKKTIAGVLAALFVFSTISPTYAVMIPAQEIVSESADSSSASSQDAAEPEEDGSMDGEESENGEQSTSSAAPEDENASDASNEEQDDQSSDPAEGSSSQPSTGEESIPDTDPADEEPLDEGDSSILTEEISQEDTIEQRIVTGNVGQVDVSIGTSTAIGSDKEFTITLSGKEERSETFTFDATGVQTKKVSFQKLPQGSYTLTVSAPGFIPYEQKVEVRQMASLIKLVVGFVQSMDYEAGQPHPGVLLLGDADGNGKLNSADGTTLVDAIDQDKGTKNTDMSGDGVTNLVDLEYFTSSYEIKQNFEKKFKNLDLLASVEQFIPAAAIQAAVPEGTQLKGSLDKMLAEEGTVTLSPKSGENISSTSPVVMELDVAAVSEGEEEGSEQLTTDGIVIDTASADGSTYVTAAEMEITYIDEDGNEYTEVVGAEQGVHYLMRSATSFSASIDETGSIVVDLGSQVAVKKVTLTIKGMNKNTNLAEISKVEFVNGMGERIPEPELNIPQNLTAKAGNKEITVSWDAETNITGYELWINKKGNDDSKAETMLLTNTSQVITTYGGDKLKNLNTYVIKVQSVNGTWTSGYCDSVEATPQPTGKPDKPDNVKATGKYKSVVVQWKNMDDTESYNLYYKQSDSDTYTSVTGIQGTSYTVSDLEMLTDYTVYVTGVNAYGESSPSLSATATTTDLNPANMPKYGLINTGEDGEIGDHIISITQSQGSMIDSPLDDADTTTNTAWGLVDKDAASYHYVNSWDDGGYNALVGRGVTCEFDQEYEMDTIAMSEVYFYYYDGLMDEIMGLYTDDLHTVLRDDVTQETIDELRERVNAVDPISGEQHPDRDALLTELDTAEKILNDENLRAAVEIHNGITTNDTNRGFTGLNAWQPLGVTAAAGETITVYVGHNSKKTGASTNLRLIQTQYHAESGGVEISGANLKVGANVITLLKSSSASYEGGGALYVQYTGSSSSDRYSVRVSGGVQVPILDLYNVTDEAERLAKAETYVNELETYVSNMEATHNAVHAGSSNKYVDMDYDEKNCILGASDIMLDTMMLSLPAQQILSGMGSGTTAEKAQKLVDSMDAMEDMMNLFYQHKGLNKAATDSKNQFPKQHLNIRYQRMFSGAFMYAAGNHIGIEYPETKGMITATPVVSENGEYVSGNYFGWGIAHEIGHCINQGAYAVVEVTNNYFAQLAQAKDSTASIRFKYEDVYDKVTSGAKGSSSNVFIQLGMYWQLHLAYDNVYNYTTYEHTADGYTQQLENLFYARVDTYARTPSKAPAPGGVSLTLSGDSDQQLMRLACAAAEKNLLDFFQRWGKTPNADTIAYAEQFEEETRAIYYINDDAHTYTLKSGKTSSLSADGTTKAIGSVEASINANAANQVDFTFTPTGISEDEILGYEIVRCTISGGEVEKQVVGFTTTNTFSDVVKAMNNRTVSYEITLIDQYLNRSAVETVDAMKIEHDGSQDKTNWTISTSGLTAEAKTTDADEEMPCEATEEDPAQEAIDHDISTEYQPTVDAENAEILMEFNQNLVVTGFKYTAGSGTRLTDYEIQLRSGEEWTTVAEGSFAEDSTVYFANGDGKYVSTYEADAVKLVIKNQKGENLSIAELDVLGVTGDNVDFRTATDGSDTTLIGKLKTDYQYGTEETDVIPAGSIVFTGKYKGNAAYNVVMLFDQDGNIVGGVNEDGDLQAQQVILSDVPDTGDIADTNDGIWIYWIEPEQNVDLSSVKQVRAELYRVNDATTNEGQRLVSDSLFETMPETLPDMELNGGTN